MEDEFWAACQDAALAADIIGIEASLTFDHETAISLADRFVDEGTMFLLESATAGPGQVARYSFVGFDPLWTFCANASTAQVQRVADPHEGIKQRSLAGLDPLRALAQELRALRVATVPASDSPLRAPSIASLGGAVGFLGYDVAACLEPTIGKPPVKELGLPDVHVMIPRNFLVVDHLTRRLSVIRYFWNDRPRLHQKVQQELRSLRQLLKRLQGSHTPPPLVIKPGELDLKAFRTQVTETVFLEKVALAMEQIRAGEIFQIQIGNRLQAETDARSFDIFRHLRILNPSPYMFFYKFGEDCVLGASPEMMVNVHGNRIVHRPIAGTRKRTWREHDDARLRNELLTSEKERAEHVMLVDLGRNDIGRISAPGTVKVEELMIVEEYSHVFHMVSQVAGELAPTFDSFEALAHSFPNGTVTGAPKVRAMELIYELETWSREFYAGSLGLFQFNGDLKSTILIRSIHIRDGLASTQASAGIVYDSVPLQEWAETRHKMAACATAIQLTK